MGSPAAAAPRADLGPVVVFRSENYGALGIVRTLGRIGVPVHCIDHEPAALGPLSRYCAGRHHWDFESRPEAESIAFLEEVAARVGGRPILIPTFDTRALLVDRHAERLAASFRLPRPAPGALRRLYEKRSMAELCESAGVPTARSAFPVGPDEALERARTLDFPLVIKAIDGDRLMRRTGRRLAIVASIDALPAAWAALDEPGCANLLLQEYIPGDDTAEQWVLSGYFDAGGACRFALTGRKLRQLPIQGGLTTLGVCEAQPVLIEHTTRIVQAAGYRGIVDMDFRHDRRDGQFKLLDVNPRVGANFRLLADRNGLDVVRAMVLDLSGRPVPEVAPRWGRTWRVEDKDLAAGLGYRRAGRLSWPAFAASYLGADEGAYWAWDDLQPSLRFVGGFVGGMLRGALRKLRRAPAAAASSPG